MYTLLVTKAKFKVLGYKLRKEIWKYFGQIHTRYNTLTDTTHTHTHRYYTNTDITYTQLPHKRPTHTDSTQTHMCGSYTPTDTDNIQTQIKFYICAVHVYTFYIYVCSNFVFSTFFFSVVLEYE